MQRHSLAGEKLLEDQLRVEELGRGPLELHSDEVVPSEDSGQPRPPKTYDFPSQPPFTAFVGNLSYQIMEGPQLMEAVENLAKERLEEPVKVLGGRIAYHRAGNPNQHRGFGYVEVETLDQVSFVFSMEKSCFEIAAANDDSPHAMFYLPFSRSSRAS